VCLRTTRSASLRHEHLTAEPQNLGESIPRHLCAALLQLGSEVAAAATAGQATKEDGRLAGTGGRNSPVKKWLPSPPKRSKETAT